MVIGQNIRITSATSLKADKKWKQNRSLKIKDSEDDKEGKSGSKKDEEILSSQRKKEG